MKIIEDQVWAGSDESHHRYLEACEAIKERMAAGPCDNQDDEEEDIPRLLDKQGNVGVISIKGSLTNRDSYWNQYYGITSYNEIRSAVIAAANDQDITHILLDVDSGGGAVSGVADTANLIRLVNDKVKPVATFSDGAMASAAYWLGSSAGEVYSGSTAVLGSIGVISTHMEYSKMYKESGIGVTVRRAGKFKALVNSFEPLTKEAEAGIDRMLAAVYTVFRDHVANMRGKTVQYTEDTMAQGREFVGMDAVASGLSDGISTFDEVISKLQAQSIDTSAKFIQHPSQDSYQGAPMKKALTEQQIAALAEGSNAVANTEQAAAQAQAAATAEGGAAQATAVASTEAGTSAAAGSESASTQAANTQATQSTDVVAYLTSAMADKDAALVEAKLQIADLTKQNDAYAAVVGPLSEVVAKSVGNLQVALGGSAEVSADMAPVQLLAEHKRLSGLFVSKFKAGGVAAVDAAQSGGDAVKLDPIQQARLDAVRVRSRTTAK